MTSGAGESFPERSAATHRFTLGRPRTVTVAPGGTHVLCRRALGPRAPEQALWRLDTATGEERIVAGGADGGASPTPEEEARRERVREHARGIVTYATDRAVERAVVLTGGRVEVVDVLGGATRALDLGDGVGEPRISPDGTAVAYVRDGALWVAPVDGDGAPTRLLHDDDEAVSFGLPEFVAAEEMQRTRGFWWSSTSDRIAVARVDERPVETLHVTDPADPRRPPRHNRYPRAGTPNADVRLVVVDRDGGSHEVTWDRVALPYLAAVSWDRHAPLLLTLQSRDQQRLAVLAVDDDGESRTVHDATASPWIDLVPGAPRWWAGTGLLLVAADRTVEPPTHRLLLNGRPLTPPGLQVRSVVGTEDDAALVTASASDPTAIALHRVDVDGSVTAVGATDGVVTASSSPGGVATTTVRMEDVRPVTTVTAGGRRVVLADRSEAPGSELRVTWLELGERRLRAALLLPTAHDGGDLPVLMDPYGGPHAQRVLRNPYAFGTSQWLADQGMAVLVVDGRGTPGRGPDFEAAVAGDLATPALEDQVDALHAAAAAGHPLDLDRVAIRGWSFGGYLAALAVLERPDVFAAAVAGAPVTEWRWYDTHYTERYLGDPRTAAGAYEHSSLLPRAAGLERPLLLVHGLADDNVYAAHTILLSRALLTAGRPHRVLPLSGITHMATDPVVARNLLEFEVDFLRAPLGLPAAP